MDTNKVFPRPERIGMLLLYGILGMIFLTAFCALLGVFGLCVCCM